MNEGLLQVKVDAMRNLMGIVVVGVILGVGADLANAQQVEMLWPQGAPGALGKEAKDSPRLFVYLPKKKEATGAAVVVCPGGGYGGLAISYEGHDIARWFNSFGVAGLVLDYRHRGKGYGHPAPLQDAQRAIRLVRSKSNDWKIDPQRIGVLGFSAGGHLASSTGTHFDAGDPQADDVVNRQSCRPDFMILCYPVIAFGESYTHRGSQRNLLGAKASAELIKKMSSEKQVTAQTPPTFLWHTDEDQAVPAENSVQFYLALKRAKVASELHLFLKGRHGLGLARNQPGASAWPAACRQWLQSSGFLGAE